MSIYRAEIQDIRSACAGFRSGQLPLEELVASVWSGSQQIVSSEETALRGFLMSVAGELDVMSFTVDDERLFDEVVVVVSRVETRLASE